MRLVFTRDERKSAGKKVDGLVKAAAFNDCTVKLLAEIGTQAAGS
jgi:hypothetical protein